MNPMRLNLIDNDSFSGDSVANNTNFTDRFMSPALTGKTLQNLWDQNHAATLDEPERLLYRSNLLGSDKRITNYGGGNTSAKVITNDPLTGRDTNVLWVKGSGGDIGSMKLDGFATLYQDKLESLKDLYRGEQFEDKMVGYLPHCTFNLNPRASSIAVSYTHLTLPTKA